MCKGESLRGVPVQLRGTGTVHHELPDYGHMPIQACIVQWRVALTVLDACLLQRGAPRVSLPALRTFLRSSCFGYAVTGLLAGSD